jgi:hypothetical protein
MAYATDTLTNIPFGAVIGGPLKAAIEAQALAARTTVDFIQAVGFEPVTNDPFVDPNTAPKTRYVTFKYEITREDGETDEASLRVPVLTIIPIPFIRMDEMSIDFVAKISEQMVNTETRQQESGSTQSHSASISSNWWWVKGSYGFNGSYSTKQSSTSSSASRYQTEYTMNVHLRAVQDDMPAGLNRMLQILETTIKETREPKT